MREVEGNEVALRVDAGADVHQRGRRRLTPADLVPAHQLDPHRRSDRLGHQRGRLGDVEVLHAVAEAPAHRDSRDPYLALRDAEHERDLRPRLVGALRAGEDPCALRGDISDGTLRPARRVDVRRPAEGSTGHVRRRGERRVDVTGVEGDATEVDPRHDRLPRTVERPEPLELVAAARQRRRRVGPLDLELGSGLDRVVLVRCDDAEEVALAHDLGARDVLDRALVDRNDRKAGAEERLAARPHDPPVKHPRHTDVLDVDARPGHDARHVDARDARPDERVLTDGLRRRLSRRDAAAEPTVRRRRVHVPAPRHRDVEQLPAQQLPVRHRLAAARDDTLAD